MPIQTLTQRDLSWSVHAPLWWLSILRSSRFRLVDARRAGNLVESRCLLMTAHPEVIHLDAKRPFLPQCGSSDGPARRGKRGRLRGQVAANRPGLATTALWESPKTLARQPGDSCPSVTKSDRANLFQSSKPLSITERKSLQPLDLRFRAQSDISARSGHRSERDQPGLEREWWGPPNPAAWCAVLMKRSMSIGAPVNIVFFSCSCPDATLINRGQKIFKPLKR